jgi:hypothetical protein
VTRKSSTILSAHSQRDVHSPRLIKGNFRCADPKLKTAFFLVQKVPLSLSLYWELFPRMFKDIKVAPCSFKYQKFKTLLDNFVTADSSRGDRC